MHPISDSDALLRAIIDNPEDDAPRLVYADFLDEHGDPPRAAFIRAQVQLARLPPSHPDRPRLIQTERTLMRAHKAFWTAWVPSWAKHWQFRRGFLEWVRCDAGTFVARADEVRSRTPLAGVRLDGTNEIGVAVFRSRALDGLRSLTLSVRAAPSDWDRLAACPYLGRLTDLGLSSNGAPAELVGALVHTPGLPALTALRLKWCSLGDDQTARLAEHPWVGRLRVLDLSNNYIGADGGSALTASPHLDGLHSLALWGNPVLSDGRVSGALRKRFGSRLRA
jgi:uncharacterized protein (TIGR02996 family)